MACFPQPCRVARPTGLKWSMASDPEFTHLHLHTDYSLLDGACDVDKLMKHVAKIGQKAVAMTDHGNIYGAVHFFDAAKKQGIKPILGCELYICQNEDHRAAPEGDKYNHMLVLAENEAGYRNLVRLTSEAALHGFYRKPRVSKAFLAKHSEGLIGFSGCLAGEVNQHLMEGKYDEAKRTAGCYEDLFGKGNYFLEIQDHGLAPDKAVCDALFKMERELNIPLIATNDSHYVGADIVAVVGGNERNVELALHLEERIADSFVWSEAVILDLEEVVAFAEEIFVAAGGAFGFVVLPFHQVLVHLAGEAAGEADEPLGVFCQEGLRDTGLAIEAVQGGFAGEANEVSIARFV